MDWTRYKRVIDSMKEEGIGQLIVTDSVSVYYLTGKLVNCMERMMALYLDVEKEKPLLIIGKLFPQNEETLGFPVVYFDDTDDAVGVLASHRHRQDLAGTFPASPHGAWRGRQVCQRFLYHRSYPSGEDTRRAGKNACGFPGERSEHG